MIDADMCTIAKQKINSTCPNKGSWKQRKVMFCFSRFCKSAWHSQSWHSFQKIKNYGIFGSPLNWFKSYLSGRYQCVNISNAKSDNKAIVCDVSQGKFLCPLLCLIYINGIYINQQLNFVFIYLLMTPAYSNQTNSTRKLKFRSIFLLIT